MGSNALKRIVSRTRQRLSLANPEHTWGQAFRPAVNDTLSEIFPEATLRQNRGKTPRGKCGIRNVERGIEDCTRKSFGNETES